MRNWALILLFLYPAAALACQAPRILHLAFVGDVMAHDVNYHMEDFRDIYRGVEGRLAAADVCFANLEFPVDATKPTASFPAFNSTRPYWQAAADSGISAFSLANNHAFDQGEEGIFQTLRSAASVHTPTGAPVTVSGIRGNTTRPFEPQTILARGIRVGFLAVTQFINQGGRCPYVNVADYRDREAADELVSQVRAASREYDVFVVSYHGDAEYSPRADPEKAAFFRRLLENGAHIVFGHHPHVFQGFELVPVKGEMRLSLLSMGNFISGMTWRADPAAPERVNPATGDSALLEVDMLVTGAGAYITGVRALPIANYRNKRGEMVVGMLGDLASGEARLGGAWTAYYRSRLASVQGLLSPLPAAGSR